MVQMNWFITQLLDFLTFLLVIVVLAGLVGAWGGT
jgi:hypothetical protein